MSPCEPATDAEADAAAAERWHLFTNTWFLETALRGRYPDAFPDGVPEERMGVEPRDLARVRADLDFVGVNLYTRTVVRAVPEDKNGLAAAPVGMGGNDGPRTEFGWEVWPRALYDMLDAAGRADDGPVHGAIHRRRRGRLRDRQRSGKRRRSRRAAWSSRSMTRPAATMSPRFPS